tara:strand:- start:430 stop:717 length:288 start_codon:yes stop_codon:yes gene_type:complete
MKSKEIKLEEIKKHNPSLYSEVLMGKTKLQDAYNEVMGNLNQTSEYKGRGTRGKNKVGLSKEVDMLTKRYKPTIEEWIDEIKRLFPFTYSNYIKD